MSVNNSHTIAQYLKLILQKKSPEFGSRLKVLLNQYLRDSQLEQFDEAALGYRKFTQYLSIVHADLVEVVKPSGSGDVLVTLRRNIDGKDDNVDITSIALRNDVWRAFTFQDLSRKRFLNKETNKVLHFKEDEDSEEKKLFEAGEQNFVKIVPVTDIQKKWMSEFADSLPIKDKITENLESLLVDQDLNQVLSNFKTLLGSYSNQWLNFRKTKIVDYIKQWCNDNSVSFDLLCRISDKKYLERNSSQASISTSSANARVIVAKLLDLVSEEDISSNVIPMILGIISIRTNM